ISRRKDPITGVSEYPDLDEQKPASRHPDLAVLREEAHRRAAQKRRPGMDGHKLAEAARSGRAGAMMVEAIDAADQDASLRDLLGALASAGQPLEIRAVPPRPFSEPFDALRLASDEYLQTHGRRPSVFLANLGPIARHSARAGYAQAF